MTANAPDQLAALAVSLGEAVASAGNRPIGLDDPQIAYFVERGSLDVFLTEYEDGHTTSSFKHVLRAGPNRLVFGVGGDSLIAVAKGLPGCQLRRVRLESLLRDDIGEALVAQVDAWLAAFAAAVAADIAPRPHPHADRLLSPGERLDAEAGYALIARKEVIWIASEGHAELFGTEEPDPNGTGLMPLTPESWLTLSGPVSATALSSQDLHDEGKLIPALAEFHRMALSAEQLNRRLLLADEANLQVSRAAHRRRDEEQARQGLFNVLSSSQPLAAEQASALLAALELIGQYEGLAFQSPPRPRSGAAESSMRDILTVSGVRAREVTLEDRWWRLGNSGALLAFQGDDNRPVALLPRLAGGYRIVDPVSGASERVNEDRARKLSQMAWSFYRPLSNDRAVSGQDLLRYAAKNLTGDLARFVITGCIAGILTIMPAVLIGVLVDRVIPLQAGGLLVQLAVGLVALAVVGTLLMMLQGTALMRLEGRVAARLGSAVWDRLLGLRSNFFTDFTAGDLSARVSVFQTLRDQVSGVVGGAILAVIFLIPAFVIIFAYDPGLGWLSLGIGLVSLLVTVVFGLLQIDPQRRRYAAVRQLAGDLFQFINGIGKLRSSGAEGSAFAFWARKYRGQQQAAMDIGKLSEHIVAFSAAVPAFASAALFAFALYKGTDSLAVGDFLAVYVMSMTFYVAIARLGQSFEAIAAIAPGVEQIQPVLKAVPEETPTGDAVVELNGEIQFDHVSFRYDEDGPLDLDDVSLRARPGEFIAIVGETGSGKSTLMHLALGLQEPSVGAVYYDGRDLANLNKRVVRKQIGVVMQDGALRPGNIADNIIGLSDYLTLDDAWRAARQAAVADDIEAMPMGMFTMVGDSMATFSGGQAQRIMIAAALVRSPRILFLDEATSWLDAENQRKVMEGIESLAVTRIVIAHRLSTIRKANRIYVLQAGRVVQQGGFDELLESAGLFRDLMRRQMA